MSSSEQQDGRWTTLRIAVTVALTAALVAPAAAWASHQFTDVPNSNVFHADIDWMRDNGVTKGCNPPVNDEYCPDDFVTREQMAAFMHRLETEGVFLGSDLDEFIPIARISLTPSQVTASSFRAPMTGEPTSNHDGTKYTVDLPGINFNITTWQALCTVRGSSAHHVTVNSVSGDLLVYVFDDTEAAVADDAHCVVYREF